MESDAQKVRHLIELKDEYERASAAKAKAWQRWKAFEQELWDELDSRDGAPKTLNFDNLEPYGKVQITRQSTVRSRVIDKDKAIEALREQGLEDALTQTSLREGPLNQFVRDWLASGQSFPEGIDFRRTPYFTVSRK